MLRHGSSKNNSDFWDKNKVTAFVGHNFPDFIERWTRDTFRKVGYGLNATTLACLAGAAAADATSLWNFLPAAAAGILSLGYWRVGLQDMAQKSHAIRRNYPVLGNFRYIFETIRPELRQYIVEGDDDGKPFDRMHRALVYTRAKNVNDTLPFGTRQDVYKTNYTWACHSMWPKTVDLLDGARHTIGCSEYGTTKPYSSSVLNVSAMSYGAISDNAILALNQGAILGGFYHNTGEGGVSRYHRQGGGDIVWNVGTGYFGCGSGEGTNRVFEPTMFKETVDECNGQIKMIEIKLSQGAKPGHGGLLPKAKITEEIAEARKLPFPPQSACHSPARHSAFSSPHELVDFIASVRELSGGLPVGIKLCVGQPGEFAALCKAIHEVGNGPDFITVDGAEGGTGAAPPELTDHVGLPLEEGLVVVRNMLEGANLKSKTTINASGRITSGFSIVKTVALGADITCAARAFMLSLGCIQALKCNTNKCPTGVATQNKELMYGLDPEDKTHRVYHYHSRTVKAASEIVGIMGYTSFADVKANAIMRRADNRVYTLSECFPEVEPGCLLEGEGPTRLQGAWDNCSNIDNVIINRRWIY
jgi:glutamate synthase domain-containing protein 2